jgi:hypothetical protein
VRSNCERGSFPKIPRREPSPVLCKGSGDVDLSVDSIHQRSRNLRHVSLICGGVQKQSLRKSLEPKGHGFHCGNSDERCVPTERKGFPRSCDTQNLR